MSPVLTKQPAPVVRRTARLSGRAWATFYLAIATSYLLTSSGRLGVSDALSMFNVTQSLASDLSFSADPCEPAPRSNHCVPGMDGRNYAGFGLIPSIVAVPAYMAGHIVSSVLHRDTRILTPLCVVLFHALFTAIVPLILALWLCSIGLSSRTAFLAALVCAFASPTWEFSKGFYSEPYFVLGLIACCFFLSRDDRAISLVAAGACFGFAVGSRIYGAILLPVIALYGVVLWNSKQRRVPQMLRNLLVLAGPIAIAFGLIAWSNYFRFGSVLKTGYQLAFPTISALLSTPLLRGMAGLLINREVGILIFVPWVAIVPLFWRRFWVRYRSEAVLVLGMIVMNYLFFAKYVGWHGGWAVGPRMLYPLVPFLVLPVAVLFDEGAPALRTLVGRISMTLIGLAFLIQGLLILYPGSRYYYLEGYHQRHGVHVWWSGQPLVEAFTALPDLLLGIGNQSGDPAHGFLLTFPNGSVNLMRADVWLLKAPLFGVPHVISWFVMALLLLLSAVAGWVVLTQLHRGAERVGRETPLGVS